MKRTGLIALLLAAVVGISGCSAAASAPHGDEPADPPAASTPAQTPPEAGSPDADTPTKDEAPSDDTSDATADDKPDASPVTPIHEDRYKSIFLLDSAQVAAIAGVTLSADTVDEAAKAFTDASAWRSQKAMAEHADLIAQAASREGHSTKRAVGALTHDDHARVKVVVIHNGHKNIAHIERGGQD